jgi:rRNA maturation RNase YbeY
VLSFTLGDEKHLEGEIYVNVDKAGRQAKTFHVTWENEITRLIVHGTLHLLGYDDGTLSDARRMKRREDKYVDLLAGKEVRPR